MPVREFLYEVIPGFTARSFIKLYGEAFIESFCPELTLEDGTLISRAYDKSHVKYNYGWSNFCVEHEIPLQYDSAAYRSLACFGDDLFAVPVSSKYNRTLGGLHFMVRPGQVGPVSVQEQDLRSMSIEVECIKGLSRDSAQPFVKIMHDWATLFRTQGCCGEGPVILVDEVCYIRAKSFIIFVDFRCSGMLTLTWLVSQILEAACTNVAPTVQCVYFCGIDVNDFTPGVETERIKLSLGDSK